MSCRLEINTEAIRAIEDEVESREEAVVNVLYKECYDSCPVRTGYMRSTINSEVHEKTAQINVDCDYGIWTELRTNWFSNAIYRALSRASRIWQGK